MGGRLSGSVEVCVCMHVCCVHVFANMPISVTFKKSVFLGWKQKEDFIIRQDYHQIVFFLQNVI